MKRILATTAIVALTSMPVFAQSDSTEQTDQTAPSATQSSDTSGASSSAATGANAGASMDLNGKTIAASDLIGKTVYIQSEDAPDSGIVDSIEGPADNWEDAGEVNDVILSADGQIESITLEAGGFLGIGAKELRSSMDELKLVSEEGSDGEFFVVFTGNRAELEEREELDRESVTAEGGSFFSDDNQAASSENNLEGDSMTSDTDATADITTSMESDTDATADSTTSMESDTDTAADTRADTEATTGAGVDANADATTGADAGTMPRLSDDERTALTAEDLEGVAVYDTADEHVGDISDLVLSNDGQIEQVIIDVGGFLGLGEKPVAISFDEIELSRDAEGVTNSIQARTDLSIEEFENMEEWES